MGGPGQRRMTAWTTAAFLVASGPAWAGLSTDGDAGAEARGPSGTMCVGTYASSLQALRPSVVAFESQPGLGFIHCLRSVATYEQVYYGRDGRLKKRLIKVSAHGTGFAYRRSGGDTLLLTNHHVATWPQVTETDAQVKGVPAGSKRIGEQLFIVRDDEDDYEPGFVPLSEVATDPGLDAAVVKARKPLPVMPYAVGRSAALRAGDAVDVRGYPLGAFAASNAGKVTNPYVEDHDRDWNHADFALDALVNSGNSGSPVFAVNCVTGEYELVGLFHAGYRLGQAMNLAVGIDEVRPLMDTLQARPRMARHDGPAAGPDARRAVMEMVKNPALGMREMRFGDRLVEVGVESDAHLVFRIRGAGYPADPHVWTEIREPLAPDEGPPRVRVSDPMVGEYPVPEAALDAEAREHLERLVAAMLVRAWRVVQYRDAVGAPPRTPEKHHLAERMLRDMNRAETEHRELLESLDGHLQRTRMAWRTVAEHGEGMEETPVADPARAHAAP